MAELNNLVVNGVARVNGELYENQTRVATSASVAAVQNIITTNSASWAANTKVTAVGNHYTPAQSAGKAASAGSVISGLGVDAAGHVVAVTGSNSITSASFATNASKLGGKAASQYASASHTHGYSTPAQVTASINALVTASGSTWSTDTKVTAVGNHYTPAQSAGKSVSAGSCISGLGVDAAGHVVAVTGSNSITSASRAISASRADSAASATSATSAATASCLGAGANTSASVAAAINAKWTYNENTIKAVKVTSASRADSAASATSATTANTASYVTWANVSGKPSSFTPSAHTHNLIVTEGDYRATASVPNDYNNNLRFRGLKNNSTIGLTIGTGSYAYVLGLRGWSDSSGGDSHELAFNNAGIFTRHGATTTWGSWVKIITSDLTGSWATAAANSHTHANKSVLDGITAAKTSSWDAAKPGTVTSVVVRSGSAYLTGNTTITASGTATLDLAARSKAGVDIAAAKVIYNPKTGSLITLPFTCNTSQRRVDYCIEGYGYNGGTIHIEGVAQFNTASISYAYHTALSSEAPTITVGVDANDHPWIYVQRTRSAINLRFSAFVAGNQYNYGYDSTVTDAAMPTSFKISASSAQVGVSLAANATSASRAVSASRADSAATATSATNVGVTNWATNDTQYRIVWVGGNGSGSSATLYSSPNITVKPKSAHIVATVFSGSLFGNASTATSATSASRAVSASRADSAASATSASWATSASRAVSAASATSATTAVTASRLSAGNVGNLGQPVCIYNGAPLACNTAQVACPVASGSATTGTIKLIEGTVTNLGTLTGNVTFTLNAGGGDMHGHEAVYCAVFNMGTTVRTITLPSGVTIMDGSVEMNKANTYYELSIMNNVAIICQKSA